MTDLQAPFLPGSQSQEKLIEKQVAAIEPTKEEIEKLIEDTRDLLDEARQMALGHLVYEVLDHASASISHPDTAFWAVYNVYKHKSHEQWVEEATSLWSKVKQWAEENRTKVIILVLGLGISAFYAKAMAQCMLGAAASFCSWSQRQAFPVRFCGFVALMSVRLIVSTLVPPTSPGFGIIIQAATPVEQKWTAMPCFLLASAVAGACPYVLDTIAWLFTDKDFQFTMLAKEFAEHYPLTCWTGPGMRAAFISVYRAGVPVPDDASKHRKLKYGKLGSSLAVIVAHVAPFMGAQTTIMQRFFLPNPFDTILSQPVGMAEDLVSMAMAEAVSNPVLASATLTMLIVSFNLARGLIFTGDLDHNVEEFRKTVVAFFEWLRKTVAEWVEWFQDKDETRRGSDSRLPEGAPEQDSTSCGTPLPSVSTAAPSSFEQPLPSVASAGLGDNEMEAQQVPAANTERDSGSPVGAGSPASTVSSPARHRASNTAQLEPEVRPQDTAALLSAGVNVIIAVVFALLVTVCASVKAAFLVVAAQLIIQMFAVPVVIGLFIPDETPREEALPSPDAASAVPADASSPLVTDAGDSNVPGEPP